CFSAPPPQEAETTESSQLEEEIVEEQELVIEETSYSADSVEMTSYVAYKSGLQEKVPGILVVHEWWGHNDYARKRTDMLAELGYVALAVDMYGDGQKAEHPDDAGQFAGMVLSN
ncbi:MAG: dienelactone hydrolase family protein, partial [Bacteroidota bacterium]